MESMVRHGDVRLWTWAEGAGPAVLCISGGPGCADYLEPVTGLLAGQARTIRFDARGCGRSSTADEYTLDAVIDDIEAIREHYGVDRWFVLGHSAGADTALLYALRHPERAAGIIGISGGRIQNDRDWQEKYRAGRDAGLETPIAEVFPPNMEVNRQLNAEWKAFCRRPELLRELAALPVPALSIYGDRDIRPSWAAEQVARLLPSATFELLRGADHHPWTTHAPELGTLLRSFMAQHSALASPQ